ncbi:UNVERIFIED_ORG: rhamnogalacturonyl hydrolase YesR [Zoogloea ramigera]|uniref:Glycoside hydrolase family 88 protein n=1 Tax=Duganella zoogloeoides TaxID=75659 RepID=A0ABZ0XYV0_9BURK|nr:glycoside hydrolase family 88 protein [Duganella zoogloeoides]WQH04930.1 glycoside hydrolase family 88 protein [Duganella zoogloeoides]
MTHVSSRLAMLLTAILASGAVHAATALDIQPGGSFRNTDNKNLKDTSEGTYPVPYKKPTAAEITGALDRVRGYVDSITPTRIIDKATGKPVTDLKKPVAGAVFEPSSNDFGLMVYEMGVIHSGLIKAAEVTGDKRYTDMTRRHFQFFKDSKPYFRAQEDQFKLGRANSFTRFLQPMSLDDSGSMCAALVRARFAKVGPDLKDMIDTCSGYVQKQQYRLADGTFARKRPQASSLWADDMYMGIPALAEMGHLTGDKAWFDDAASNVLTMAEHLYNKQNNLFTHGWNANNPDAPRFYWARANGWAVLAMSDLLDVLPKDHPSYNKVLAQLRASLHGIAETQSGTGLWHQMLDRNDSYLETSATAIFVYVFAHAINEGWISPTTYGSIAQAGWVGLSTRINAKGQVEGTCVGTTFASDHIYYYNRPTSVDAMHGYGPVLLAGAEMLRMLKNPEIDIQHKLRTYHYVPREHGKAISDH